MNEHETFTEIYERYAELILKSVMAQTGDIELAEEVCQQTFANFYQHMKSVDLQYVKTWLIHVSNHLLIDYWRKASTRNEVLDEDSAGVCIESAVAADIAGQCTAKVFLCDLLRDLRTVNVNWYEVIDHVCVRGESCEEAAEQLGISAAVLRARLHRARNYIREKYEDPYLR